MNTNYNPDVLTCLANLSNDEVFTPPGLANDMLDLLPASLWRNPDATFLDPVCKSGVFLREIAKRLDKGLETQIPDRQKRINHIFTKQVFGIAITELTSLLSRRSIYGSKIANGKFSFCETFKDEQGNLLYERIEHKWDDGRCQFCGANQSEYDRDEQLESHAYQFIHTEKPEELFKMKFDVIIGNPPYQLSTAGDNNGAQAKPLYHLFIQQARKLTPRHMIFIVPSRWFTGGWGLDEFRKEMITDLRVKEIHDFPDASECFPGVDIKGGVCYFLWERDYNGKTKFCSYKNGVNTSSLSRYLHEGNCDVLIRMNEAIPILSKIRSKKEETFDELVSTKKPFGLITNYHGSKSQSSNASIKLYGNKRIEWIHEDEITRRRSEVHSHKIIVPKAVGSGDGATDYIRPIYCEPGAACTETYLLVGPFSSKSECENVMSYFETRFFHFLVTLQKNTQDCMKRVYSFVPIQNFKESWSDEKLFKKYSLSPSEIEFIRNSILPNR
jgi:site-specific DNA-methyltransferase (adenine-specific)